MKNNITKKLILYFTVTLLVFAVAVGALFTVLFVNTMTQHNKTDLEKRAETIARTLAGYMEGAQAQTSKQGRGNGPGQAQGQGGFGAFLNLADDIAMGEVWLVDKDTNLISKGQQSAAVEPASLPPDGDTLIQNALNGETGFSESFSELVGTSSITVCVPAVGSDGTVLAAVLLHAPAEGIRESIKSGLWILALSTFAALVLSVFIAALLSRRFIRPIRAIDRSVKKMADGDYLQTIDIPQKDEIGALAGNMNALSQRLLAAQDQRERLEKERQEFYADISHELRTPVTVMRGSLEALRDEKVTDEEKKQAYYGQMIAETQYMQNMVNDLLDFSRLKDADYVLDKEPLNLADVLSDTVRSIRRIAEKKQVAVLYDNPHPMIRLDGNYEKLRQMFLIVLDNAVKFSPEHDAVTVDVKQDDDRHVIRIADNGPGIDSEKLPHIFDRFYKEKSAQNKSGTGIGLAIAKQVANRHGIQIEVHSATGGGACFEFII